MRGGQSRNIVAKHDAPRETRNSTFVCESTRPQNVTQAVIVCHTQWMEGTLLGFFWQADCESGISQSLNWGRCRRQFLDKGTATALFLDKRPATPRRQLFANAAIATSRVPARCNSFASAVISCPPAQPTTINRNAKKKAARWAA